MPPLRAFLTVALGTAFLSLLFLPDQVRDGNRLGWDGRPELEVLLLLGGLGLLTLLGRRLPLWARATTGVLVALAALFHFLVAAVPSFFERDLDLYWDLPHVPGLIGLFVDAAGPVKGWASLFGVSLLLVLLSYSVMLLVGAMERALRGPWRPPLALGVAALGLVLLPLHGGGAPLISDRLSREVGYHAARTWQAWRIMHGAPGPYAEALAEPQPPARDLGRLRHHDVYLVFFESYGTTVLDDPQFASTIRPALDRFADAVEDAGYYMLSNRIVSPTFGGGSWLAHGTMASGLKLDPFLYRLLLSTDRRTLPEYMKAAGYQSLNIMPGIKHPWPEGEYWGFDRTLTAKDLGYDGPPFGWFGIPDQWTLKVALQQIDARPHPPLFTQIVLLSSHTPFAPVPPYVADWSDAGPYKSVVQAEWDRIYTDPDWWHLEQPYLQSVQYDLKVLAGWLKQLKGQPLVIILGDHQPPGFVSGSVAPHTVPIHVLSRDEDLVLPFASLGYTAGAIPPEDGAFKGMESFLPDFLRLFASGHSVVLGPRTDRVN
ncbi:MAG TPA: sulfatase-like hydrolase/transferase [Stellaceae bacterium]|nr:sulfatase-like hydrolase/transferase [Stellaceae bacterium]